MYQNSLSDTLSRSLDLLKIYPGYKRKRALCLLRSYEDARGANITHLARFSFSFPDNITVDTTSQKKLILILNGSLHGQSGNTARLIAPTMRFLKSEGFDVEVVHLVEVPNFADYEQLFIRAAGFVFMSGVYWAGVSSVMQRFIEFGTRWEGKSPFLGKSAVYVGSSQAVGGLETIFRMMGIAVMWGCQIPPMGFYMHLRTNQIVAASGVTDPWTRDLSQPPDLRVVIGNLAASVNRTGLYRPWRLDDTDPNQLWLEFP